jgi:hypothetical protein
MKNFHLTFGSEGSTMNRTLAFLTAGIIGCNSAVRPDDAALDAPDVRDVPQILDTIDVIDMLDVAPDGVTEAETP